MGSSIGNVFRKCCLKHGGRFDGKLLSGGGFIADCWEMVRRRIVHENPLMYYGPAFAADAFFSGQVAKRMKSA